MRILSDGLGLALARWLALTALLGGCKSSSPQTAEEAHREITAAAARGDVVEVHRLLDRKSQWSLISLFEAKREIRELVQKHYPADRRARELRRTQIVARAGNAPAYFVILAQQEKLLEGLARASKLDGKQGGGDQVEIRSGDQRLAYCREDKGWKYCGLRSQIDEFKVRAARDLALVKENAEAFDKSR